MSFGVAPVLAGITLPRPNAAGEAPERVGSQITLASGSMRSYTSGVRFSVELVWNRLTEDQLATVRQAAAAPVAAYTHLDGSSYVVMTEAVSATPLPGTDPVRFEVSLPLVEQTPRRA